MNRISPDNNMVVTIEQSDIVTPNFEDQTIEINFSNLRTKIEENQQLIENQRQQYYLAMIDDFLKDQNYYSCYIEVQSEAFYNFVIKEYKLIEKTPYPFVSRDDNPKTIRYFRFKFQMQTTNYTSNVNNVNNENNEKIWNYLKYSSSSKFILRKSNEENQQIEIPLSLNISTGIYKHRKENLVLERSKNDVISLNIQWEFNRENSEIQLDLEAPGGINNVAIKAVLYSRIIIKESIDYVAQTHKNLQMKQKNIENIQYSYTLNFGNIKQEYPPLLFGDKIISHHIVILTLDFKIKSCNDWLKKNLFQIEIPVDLVPGDEMSENITQLYRNKYFDQIRVLDKAYKDYQKYI